MCRQCLFCEKEEGDLYKINDLEEVCFQSGFDIDYIDMEYNEEFELKFYNSAVLSEIIQDDSLGVCEFCLNDFKYQLIEKLSSECTFEEFIVFIRYIILDICEYNEISTTEYINNDMLDMYNHIDMDQFFYFLDQNCRDKYTVIRQYLRLNIEKLSSYEFTADNINQDFIDRP